MYVTQGKFYGSAGKPGVNKNSLDLIAENEELGN